MLTVYHFPNPAQPITWMLEELKQDYQCHLVDFCPVPISPRNFSPSTLRAKSRP